MPNALLTPTVIAHEALRLFLNHLVFGKLCYTEFKNEFKKIGDTVTIRKPVRFITNDGADITGKIQDVTETSMTLTIDQRKNVAWEFSARDLTLTIEEYSKRYMQPAVAQLANAVDFHLSSLVEQFPMLVGSAGVTPATFAVLGAASQKLDETACPDDERHAILDPAASWALADALKGLFSGKVDPMIERGLLGRLAELSIWKSQNIRYHTKGTATGTPVTNGAGQTGAELVTDGWTNSISNILRKGDVITIADVYAVNHMSKDKYGHLKQFVVTEDVDSGASTGPATVPISPAIVVEGAYQNVNAATGDGKAITVVGSHRANVAMHRNAIALAMIPIEVPDSASWAKTVNSDGVAIRVIKDYDIKTDAEIIRLDAMWGAKVVYDDCGVRIAG